MFISFSGGNKKLKTDILLERKIFHLTSEKHLQVAAGKEKGITSLFAAVTMPLPVSQGWRRAGPGWAALAVLLGLCYTAKGGYEVATMQKCRFIKVQCKKIRLSHTLQILSCKKCIFQISVKSLGEKKKKRHSCAAAVHVVGLVLWKPGTLS